ncbi:hypothetical protein ACLKA6_017504 [Drosophila palustris]
MSSSSSNNRTGRRAVKRQAVRLPFHPQKRARRAPPPLELTTSLPDVLELAASPLDNGAVEAGLTPPPTASPGTTGVTFTWPEEAKPAELAKPPVRALTPTIITIDDDTEEEAEQPDEPLVRLVETVGIAWPHEVSQEARRMNPAKRRTHLVWCEGRRYKVKTGQGRVKDQVYNPYSNKDFPSYPSSNKDQVLNPCGNKDTLSYPSSIKDQVLNPCGNRDTHNDLRSNQDQVNSPCGNKDILSSPCGNKESQQFSRHTSTTGGRAQQAPGGPVPGADAAATTPVKDPYRIPTNPGGRQHETTQP